ncbi:MAG: contact-dependent growth inhibition system immunity protein [Candidatus Methylacidiphilales bacterium]
MRELDGDELISLPSDLDTEPETDSSPLSKWYAEIKDTDIEELEAFDLDQLLVQRFHRLFIIPVAIERLIDYPVLAGVEHSDLLETLSLVTIEEWQYMPSSAALLLSHMPQIKLMIDALGDAGFSSYASKLKSNLDIVSHLV